MSALKKNYETIQTQIRSFETGSILQLSLNRPDVRNAFNERLIIELQEIFDALASDADEIKKIRAVVLRGEGNVFCAGGDLKWMQSSLALTSHDNLEDTRRLSQMFDTLNRCPKPVVGLIHGAAIGGGVGLVSICDYVIASKETLFSLAEVRLGIVPACIGPFVLAKIGESQARAYFVSAERFDANRALQIGLVHEVVQTPADLEKACERVTTSLLQGGPQAMATAKSLIREIKARTHDENIEFVSKLLADLRVSPEGQEGLRAFLEKRKPSWMKS